MPAACDSVLEDIEDIVSAEDVKPHDRQFVRSNVFPKVRKRNSQRSVQTEDDPPSDSIIPGVQKIWIRTWGCSHNNSDGEYMAGQLAAYGYKITDNCLTSDMDSCSQKIRVAACQKFASCIDSWYSGLKTLLSHAQLGNALSVGGQVFI
ncbi:threonylcarbamoyladenosine tRNA methylthiotransferase [Pitangus sulphuratus]|nr:threonylcarbamoyladenosine tRNA methylthiotransferase [Pitangus sulphuratus]